MLSKLSQLIFPYFKLLLGFSGGLDSTVLLHCLMLLRNQYPDLQLRAIHVHHGLSKNADDWVTHCELICKTWNVPLTIKRVIVQNEGLGVEGQARKARYNAFASALLPGEVLITAHHLDDQCETLLLALKRGSGPNGLSSMSTRDIFTNTQRLRPLLNTPRIVLEQWAIKHNLHWIKDESNYNEYYDRNFLRLQILPLLIKRWPHFPIAVARSAKLCAEQEILINELIANDLGEVISKEGAMNITLLRNKSSAYRAALLRRWLAMHQITMPSYSILTRIWHEVALAKEDANPRLRLNQFEIRRYQGYLWSVPRFPTITNCCSIIHWPDSTKPLVLPEGIGQVFLQSGGHIRKPCADEQITIRFLARGLIEVAGRQGRKKIKKIWQEYKIPPWRRKTTPLLFYGENLIAAADVFITKEGFKKNGMRLIWKKTQI